MAAARATVARWLQCATLTLVVAPVASAAKPPKDGAVLEREAYRFPFDSYEAWLKFMDRAPNPAERAEAMKQRFPREAYEACTKPEGSALEWMTYASDGLRVRALLMLPARKAAPLVVFLHGGVKKWGRITTIDVLELCRLVDRGYAVVAPTFRGEIGSEGTPNLGAGEVADVLNAVSAVSGFPQVDGKRVVLWGFSRGGGATYRVLARSPRFAAAIVQAGPTDFVNARRRAEFHEHVYPGVVDGYERDADAALRAISPIYWPEKINVPLLLLHGTKDERVDVSHAHKMVKALMKLGRKHELVLIEGADHSMAAHYKRVRRAVDDFLGTHLGQPERRAP